MKDTNGDDKADLRESLIRGWSIRDTHALASNLKYGLDNWVWGAVGYSGFNGTVGGQALNFNQALYRFSRDGNRMEHMANFTNNTWGLAFNETFDVFGSTANGEHSVYVAIPRPYYQGVTGLTRRRQEEDRRPLRDAGEHPEGPAGGRAGRVHRRGGAQLLHRARVPRGVPGTASPS